MKRILIVSSMFVLGIYLTDAAIEMLVVHSFVSQ